MQKFAVVFPGQGSQKQGMLSSMHEQHAVVANTFREAGEVLGLDLWEIVRDNPDGRLDSTEITQPALLTASVALWRLWQERQGPLPELLAGHSLGEYSALVCAGVMAFPDAVDSVHQRGRFMQTAVPAGEGAMAAIIGLDDAVIAEACRQASDGDAIVSPANFNAPGQTVIAGEKGAVDRAVDACRQAGAKRALPLNVSVPSHCALMKPAAEQLAVRLESIEFRKPSIPVIQNVNGRTSRDPQEIRDNLLKQLYMPVQWVDSIHCLGDLGIGNVVELGPGKVLSGLVRRVNRNLACYNSEDEGALDQAIETLRN
ncbi:MAG: ACP S-malonyltransferase [Pseudomonadota bacterium]